MLDIGFMEILVIGALALIVVGPKELPGLLRTVGQYAGKARAMAREFQRTMEDAAREADLGDVADVVKVKLWFWQNPDKSGIFNLGTGRCQSFNDVADAVIDWHKNKGVDGNKEYIPFPDHLNAVTVDGDDASGWADPLGELGAARAGPAPEIEDTIARADDPVEGAHEPDAWVVPEIGVASALGESDVHALAVRVLGTREVSGGDGELYGVLLDARAGGSDRSVE